MLLDTIEKDIETLLQFIVQQQVQIENYRSKLNYLIESRDIISATKDVVFGGQNRVKNRQQRRNQEIRAQGLSALFEFGTRSLEEVKD